MSNISYINCQLIQKKFCALIRFILIIIIIARVMYRRIIKSINRRCKIHFIMSLETEKIVSENSISTGNRKE